MSTSFSLSPENHERFNTTLSKIPLFKTILVEDKKYLIKEAVPRHYEAGKIIYLEGEPANFVYILENGWVKATRMTKEGREQGLLFLHRVDIFGDVAAFSNKTYPCTTTALEAVNVWAIPSEIFIRFIKNNPDLSLAIIRKLSERVLYYIGLVEDLSLKSVEARLASTLLNNMVLQDGQMIVPRRVWTTLDEMAVRLGTVRDVLSRTMKTLESEGFLRVEKKVIFVLDPNGLAERAQR